MSSTSKTARRWTAREDRTLQEALRQYGNGEEINWHHVASHLPNRNNKDCRKRWIYGLMPTLNKGPWTREEDELLIEGIRLHSFKWALVSQMVKTRQPDQCSRRWHESLNPAINHGRWSLLEDQCLKEAVQLYGRKWTEIVERYFPDRTPIATKNRYEQRFVSKSGKCPSPKEEDAESSSTSSLSETTTTVEPGPKLLWYIHDHSQGNPTPQLLASDALATGGSAYDPFHETPLFQPPIDIDSCDPLLPASMNSPLHTPPSSSTNHLWTPPPPAVSFSQPHRTLATPYPQYPGEWTLPYADAGVPHCRGVRDAGGEWYGPVGETSSGAWYVG